VTAAVSTPCIVIAGTGSGVGKTTVVSGLCGALRNRRLKVSVFKCGPDYLDPTYHFRAAGVRSQTLDGWMMGKEGVLSTFLEASSGSDIAVIEGVMGLFDGVEPTSDAGSTAEIAKWLGAPVILVVDASGMSRSVAAMVNGFASFDSELRVAGVICNRVGSKRHLEILQTASTATPVLGGLPKDPQHSFPERHLGLRTADEDSLPSAIFQAWSGHIEEWCDVDRIVGLARTAAGVVPAVPRLRAPRGTRCRIGIAMDEAFHFYYDENLRLLLDSGAEIVEFSPIHSTRLPDADGLYLGGGYPEVHAAGLSGNEAMRREILAFCAVGRPVYAECGGLMYLCDGIRQLDGARYPMVGWFGADAVMCDRLQALGYVEATTNRETVIGSVGKTFRGHQFRYSNLEWKDSVDSAYKLTRRRDGQRLDEGFWRGSVLGSYVHAHWASNASIPESFVEACGCGVPGSKRLRDGASYG
jgi:cobyrinic acid a,c-diamide synthase